MEIVGWMGAILFAMSAAPQAWMSYKQGHSEGVSNGLLSMWFGGELLSMIAMAAEPQIIWYVMFNYVLNFLFLLVIIHYKIHPRG